MDWKKPQPSVAPAITTRGPNRSASMPPGICMSAYVRKNELSNKPCTAGPMLNSFAISGIATDNDARST